LSTSAKATRAQAILRLVLLYLDTPSLLEADVFRWVGRLWVFGHR